MTISDSGWTSFSELRRTLVFLAKAAAAGFIIALIADIAMLDDSHTIFSKSSIRIISTPFLIVSFLGAMFIFPVGLLKTVKWWLLMPRELSSNAEILDRLFFPFIVLVRPNILTDPNTEVRQKMIDGLKWAGAGSMLILITVIIGTWHQSMSQ